MNACMRWSTAGLVLALCAAMAHAAPAADFVEQVKAARQARQAKDYAASARLLRAALELRPAHPTALFELAATYALQGDAENAIEALEALARMGLTADPSREPAFAGLAGSGRYERVRKALDRNREPVGRNDVTLVFTVPMRTYIPEGLAYDQDTGAFFIGGVHERRIERYGRSRLDAFVAAGGGGLWAPLGMAADSRRRLLWVASSGIPQMRNAEPAELGRAAVLAFDLDTGVLKRKLPLQAPGEHLLGDLIVTRKGKIYATDSRAGVLYEADSSSGDFRALTAPGALVSPQGVVQAENRNVLYVADHTQGLFRYDIDKGKLERLEVARDICVYGIDGLYRYRDDLIAVQNGIRPHRVVRFTLDRRGRRVARARVLVANLPSFDEPTLGVVVGNRFNFVANSQWNRFDDKNQLPPKDQLRNPTVLRVTLDDEPDRAREAEPASDPFGTSAPSRSPLPLPACPPFCN